MMNKRRINRIRITKTMKMRICLGTTRMKRNLMKKRIKIWMVIMKQKKTEKRLIMRIKKTLKIIKLILLESHQTNLFKFNKHRHLQPIIINRITDQA